MAQPRKGPAALDFPAWKTALAWTAAVLLCALFLTSGLWKLLDPIGWSERVAQAKIPAVVSLPAAILVGISETLAAVLILMPRFRRWGALVAAALLVVFMLYFALNYTTLRGEDCSCFPWLKRVVGPGFFIGDAAMLLGAAVAWLWSRPSYGFRPAGLIAAALAVFALASYGFEVSQQTGVPAPTPVIVDGKPYSLSSGRIFLFFFDPECMHCFDAAQRMSKLNWGTTKVIVVPVQNPQFAPQFLHDTGYSAPVSTSSKILRQVFSFVNAPAGVVLEHGRERATFREFDDVHPWQELRQLGYIK